MDDGGTTQIEQFLGIRLHGFTTVVRIERGMGFITTAAGRVAITAGDIAVLPPGSIAYAFRGERRAEILAIRMHLDAGMIVRTVDVPGDLFERPDGVVIGLLRAAPVVAHLPRSIYEQSVMRALQQIDAQPSSARLNSVAHELGYTADGLGSLLARQTGAGFAAWRDALAMAHVRAALTKEKPVVRIARDLDFEAAYLHRRFARSHGLTPSMWRKAPAIPVPALAHDWDSVLHYFNAAKPQQDLGPHRESR
jgi:AraC-like DNA-binding protein